MPLGEGRAPPPALSSPPQRPALEYLANADPHDPLVAPATSAEVLSKFPPTLIITGTRGFELSSALYTHSQMVKLGVDADLHVWEGMFHGFFYNPDVPESRDCYDVIVKFFARHLGRARGS
jgi:acetyl esterase/lipase